MKIITFDQRSPAWHKWRAQGIGASEQAMVQNESPFGTSQKLWELKLGLRKPDPSNPAIEKGVRDEDAALNAYEQITGEIMIPLCAEHDTIPYLRASFDGIRPGTYDKALEIKCPGIKTHENALVGQVPFYYIIQMNQQMLVADLEQIDFMSYFKEYLDPNKRCAIVTIHRTESLITKIKEESEKFWEHVLTKTPMYAEGWAAAANYWAALKDEEEALKDYLEVAKNRLIDLAAGKDMQGNGVSLSVSAKEGSIDYKAIVTAEGIDIAKVEKYRKPGSVATTIRRIKNSAEAAIDATEPTKPIAILNNLPSELEGSEEWNF